MCAAIKPVIALNIGRTSVMAVIWRSVATIVLVAYTFTCGIPSHAGTRARINRKAAFVGGSPTNISVGAHRLGLSTARELARAHGGDVSLLRADATWTELSLSLPRGA
jgi:hypothetical protein